LVTDTDCSHGWTCIDRKTSVVKMVAWHNQVAGTPVAHWYSDRTNLIAFSRGSTGWIAINNESRARTRTFSTGLPQGRYCDILHGTFKNGTCSGKTVTVDARGKARVTVKQKDAVAFTTADPVSPEAIS
jgi:alpha-amylase